MEYCSGKEWSGLSESNRHLNLGKVPYYHYTKAASNDYCSLQHAQAVGYKLPSGELAHLIDPYETWLMRADLTTGERRWRSANRSALSLSV